MLLLSRRVDQSLRIGDDVTLTVCDFNGKTARIGVDAPEDVDAHREAVYQRIQSDLNDDGLEVHQRSSSGTLEALS